jgi:hypothetical protein
VVDTDPNVMATALRTVLNDDTLWLRLSSGAGQTIERFDAIRVARQYIELAITGGLSPRNSPLGDRQLGPEKNAASPAVGAHASVEKP